MKLTMSTSMPGVVFEHGGKVPSSVYQADRLNSLEKAVHNNDAKLLQKLFDGEEKASIKLKIGKMTCIEYAAMMGYTDVLQSLMENSVNLNILKKYFTLEDVIARAYMISKNKKDFFDNKALAEANRYEAALYTAIEYNQPGCVQLMLAYLGTKEPGRHVFQTDGSNHETLNAGELAKLRGHTECYELISEQNHRGVQMGS